MSADLYSHYERELSHLRELAREFAKTYPKVAGRLRLDNEQTPDPHVERLIQGFAFLTGRVRQKLDDEFPELTETLLSVLYPHYQAPVPSMGIVQFHLAAEQAESPNGYRVNRHAVIQTPPSDGIPCTFRSVYPVHLWPVTVPSAKLSRPPFKVPETPKWRKAAYVLELELCHLNPQSSLSGLKLDTLRFFLRGLPHHAQLLYELLLNHVSEIALATKPTGPFTLLPAGAIRPVGFEPDEGMLPYPARSHIGYRLLTEFFTFPRKFLFVELTGLAGRIPADAGSAVRVYVYLEGDDRLQKAVVDLEQFVKADTFRLGCTPVVNLYQRSVGPVKMDPTQYEYRLTADHRNLRAHEIYTVDDAIVATNADEQKRTFYPLFSTQHGRNEGTYWVASRRAAVAEEGQAYKGTDVYLSLVDLNQARDPALGWTLDVKATCLNRDLPEHLPSHTSGALRLTVAQAAGVAKVEAMTDFTRTYRPAMQRGALWRLISHLSLNHLSLTDRGETAEALREVLRLYEFTGDDQARRMIEGVKSVKAERVVARPAGAICRGVQVTVVFDAEAYAGHELFLFASVLERFFGLYGSLNSFTKFVAKVKGGEETLHEWEPRAGDRPLI